MSAWFLDSELLTCLFRYLYYAKYKQPVAVTNYKRALPSKVESLVYHLL